MQQRHSERPGEEMLPFVICALNDIPSRRAMGFRLMRIDAEGREEVWPIVIVRWGRNVFGYVNRCPHGGTHLDWERGSFLDPDYGTRLMCGKHGALFDIATGTCIDGPCTGTSLEPVPLVVLDDDICVVGVPLAEDGDPA
ncbi:MAG: Rieske 2Fe-2S domain-containing protein [Oricola sp.]